MTDRGLKFHSSKTTPVAEIWGPVSTVNRLIRQLWRRGVLEDGPDGRAPVVRAPRGVASARVHRRCTAGAASVKGGILFRAWLNEQPAEVQGAFMTAGG